MKNQKINRIGRENDWREETMEPRDKRSKNTLKTMKKGWSLKKRRGT
jgi:hypothetical protein